MAVIRGGRGVSSAVQTGDSSNDGQDKVAPKRRRRRWRFPRRKKPPLWSEVVTATFPAYAEVLDRAVRQEARRYHRFSFAHMWWFRISGFVEIVLSVSFPLVINVLPQDPVFQQMNNTIATGISVGIALVAALQSFYGWSDNWRLYRTQELAVMTIVRRWELALLPLTTMRTPDAKRAHLETRRAIGDLAKVLQHEQQTFFGSMSLPEEIIEKASQSANGDHRNEGAGDSAKRGT
jgi:Protein of unknown function (DUF4231)